MIQDNEEFELPSQDRPRALGQLPGWFKARFDGQCVLCSSPIYEGEWARMTDDGTLCNDCGSVEEAD